MIYNYVSLNSIVWLTIPNAWGLVKIEIVSQRQLFQTCRFHFICIMDNDFGPYIIPAAISFGQNRSNCIFVNIVLGD